MTMNIWHDIDPKRISPDDFIAVIEIPYNVPIVMDSLVGSIESDMGIKAT